MLNSLIEEISGGITQEWWRSREWGQAATVVDVAVSAGGFGGVDMVFDTGSAAAVAGNLSVSEGGDALGQWLCGMAGGDGGDGCCLSAWQVAVYALAVG